MTEHTVLTVGVRVSPAEPTMASTDKGSGLGQACWPGVQGDLRWGAWHRPNGHTPQKREEKKEATFRHMMEQTQCPSGRPGQQGGIKILRSI